MGFGSVPLKRHIGEKLVKTGAKNTLDFFAHAHIKTLNGKYFIHGKKMSTESVTAVQLNVLLKKKMLFLCGVEE